MKDDRVLYAIKNHICFIKLIGTVKCSTIEGFDTLVKQITNDKNVRDVIIDLCDVKYIDSTNMGIIAEIARFMIDKYNRKPALVSTNDKITVLLENMGFNKILILIKDIELSGKGMKEVSGEEQDELEKAQMILEAHRAIMEISEKNKSIFKDVVEILGKQIDAQDQ